MMPQLASLMHDEDKLAFIKLLEAKLEDLAKTRLTRYTPYPKQAKFHTAGGYPHVRERLLIAANQVGKTLGAAAESAFHLTGEYPDWWDGAQWNYPTAGWAGSVTAQGTRDSVQRLLLGLPNEWGTGMIPGRAIVDIKRASNSVPDGVDTVTVRHASGGTSRLTFKNYEQGREKWQAESLDWVWLDEEPPEDIYFEALTRTNATDGILYLTFTPLLGMSRVVKRFLKDKAEGTYVVHMGLEDALHYTDRQRKLIEATYPEHEREARAKGWPSLGSGLVFPVPESQLIIDAFPIPEHWARICGLDFGWDHPTAALWLAWDRDTDILYAYDEYKRSKQTPVVHAAAIKARGKWIPIAWPHDGVAHDKGGGEPLAVQYRKQGCNMLEEKATHPPAPGEAEGTGGYSVEAGVLEMLDRMQTGRLRIFRHLAETFAELRLYHREDGKIVKEDDDLLDAGRAGVMMLRHAKVQPRPKRPAAGFVPADAGCGY